MAKKSRVAYGSSQLSSACTVSPSLRRFASGLTGSAVCARTYVGVPQREESFGLLVVLVGVFEAEAGTATAPSGPATQRAAVIIA